ncbi:NADH:ubiquinone oxidoreductase [Yoonia sp. 208BN28-4]|uniref:NADH:ubiquinone oxidoreductase n=1 Tax=Yoonia sp. 208BN28-4 TaxID=3126505 RepID=UPI0030B7EA79
MKDTAPISLGIIAVAGLFGLIAAGVAFVLYEYAVAAAIFVGAIVAVIAAVVLMLGWRSPQAGPMGPRDVSPDGNQAQRSGMAPSATGTPVGATPVMAGASVAGGATVDAMSGKASPQADAAHQPASTPSAPAPTAPAQPSPSTATASAATTAQKPDDTGILEEPDRSVKAAPAATPAPAKPAPAPAPATPAPAVSDADKPQMLTAARDGGPDNLKQIKGVGPKLEGMLHRMGVYHFDQVASWGPNEVAWVDQNLEGFKGRVSRDNWVPQAKVLAEGGATDFSSKVKKGGVY